MFAKINKWLKNNESGFTLIELMVVVVILGILAAVIIPQFSNSTDKARAARAKAELRSMQNAIEVYYLEYNASPAAADLVDEIGYDPTAKNDPWGNSYQDGTSDSLLYFYSQGPDTTDGGDDIASNDL
ncbi:type II secretion system protein [Metallumcola ferriviriculae]|uniref:type II secretion system protein n=1 Tax=Metallumcola ferriviriculae TaxID=3039180 RepID=UPI003457A26D